MKPSVARPNVCVCVELTGSTDIEPQVIVVASCDKTLHYPLSILPLWIDVGKTASRVEHWWLEMGFTLLIRQNIQSDEEFAALTMISMVTSAI